MRELLILFFVFLFNITSVCAYELVLPKEKKSTVTTNYAFFVGKAKHTEIITINEEKVFLASNGAFAHTVKLKDGENRIVMKSNFNTQVYRIHKIPKEPTYKPDLIEFEPKLYTVIADNTPLRSTPIDYGMNRLSHLFKDTYLLLDGEKGSFYRVLLAKNKQAWVSKDQVKECYDAIFPGFVTTSTQTFKNASIHSMKFTEKLPYTIEEDEKEIVFRVYNSFVPDQPVYNFNFSKPSKYSYTTKLEDGDYEFKLNYFMSNNKKDLVGLTIVVDPGHGGYEKGAIGCLGDEEKNINLAIANELFKELELLGATVIMTRECDGTISLEDRVKIAKENQADIFLSIHLNSIPDIEMNVHKNRGTSVYFYNPNSKGLATVLEESVAKGLGTRRDGVRSASFAVIRPTDYISALIEVAYMTNPLDSVLYSKETFPAEVAKSISEGLLKYVSE